MRLEDAVNASQIWAARGYDETGKCVCSVAVYPDKVMWLKGFGGAWAKEWVLMTDEDRTSVANLSFRPFGPKPEDQIEQEIVDALKEINAGSDDDELPLSD